jgi:glycosyltransferase involved in cell wall biosynthesis
MVLNSSISVVVPVYNSAKSLNQLAQRLANILPNLTDTYQLILVNDCSTDNSWQIIENLTSSYSWIIGIDLMRNFGQHNAILCGIRASSYDVIVTMDDDLQHPPEEMEKLLNKLSSGFDVVYGTPKIDQHGVWRNLASKTTKLALRMATDISIVPNISSYRAIRRHLCRVFDEYKSYFVLIDVILAWGTSNISSVEVNHEPRAKGKSTYTFRKLLFHTLNLVTGFSVVPLRLASYLGFIFALFGVIVLVFVLIRYFIEGGVVSGFPFLASIISIFSGMVSSFDLCHPAWSIIKTACRPFKYNASSHKYIFILSKIVF